MVVRASHALSVILACLGCSSLFATGCDSDSDDAVDNFETSDEDSGTTSQPVEAMPDAGEGGTDTTSSSPDADVSTMLSEGDEPDAATSTDMPANAPDGATDTASSSDERDGAASEADAANGEVCWLEYLGDWVRCEFLDQPTYLEMPGATSDECARACLADPECVAVNDYSWLGIEGLGCGLNLGTCDDATLDTGASFDGSLDYRKMCGPKAPEGALVHLPTENGVRVSEESECVFKAMEAGCEDANASDAGAVAGATLAECFELCDEREDCSAVAFFVPTSADDPLDPLCTLHLSTCDSEVEAPTMRYLKKYCGQDAEN